jgi:phage terminase large subunit-like protein
VAGVVAQGPVQDWRAYILEDVTVQGASPMAWAEAAVSAMHRWNAERMVAEVNQGGDLVEQVIRQVDPLISLKKVHASKGKAARAEPIAALYEQGRVHHFTGLAALEEEMCQLTMHGFHGKGSPDRTDALVWALTELMILPAKSHMSPQVRTL